MAFCKVIQSLKSKCWLRPENPTIKGPGLKSLACASRGSRMSGNYEIPKDMAPEIPLMGGSYLTKWLRECFSDFLCDISSNF